MTNIAKFLRKLRIDNEQSLEDMANKIDFSPAYLSAIEHNKRKIPEDMKEKIFDKYILTEEQKLELSRIIAEGREKLVIDLAEFQNDRSEYVDTAVMFAHDLSKMNRNQLEEVRKLLLNIKSEVSPM